MPKPAHLSWEEAASPGLVNSTAYRQLISKNGAAMKLGDRVLIWGASGGLGSYATQMALAGGATPICVVSLPDKAAICRAMGAELIIDRRAEATSSGTRTTPNRTQGMAAPRQEDPRTHRRVRRGHRLRAPWPRDLRRLGLRRPQGRHHRHLCASTSGYMHEYDNRYLWMNLKRIISSHFANYREAGGQRVDQPRADPPDAVQDLCPRRGGPGRTGCPPQPAPGQGRCSRWRLRPACGVTDPEKRARFGEREINRFRGE